LSALTAAEVVKDWEVDVAERSLAEAATAAATDESKA